MPNLLSFQTLIGNSKTDQTDVQVSGGIEFQTLIGNSKTFDSIIS
mgnify:CR=1 FL=1